MRVTAIVLVEDRVELIGLIDIESYYLTRPVRKGLKASDNLLYLL